MKTPKHTEPQVTPANAESLAGAGCPASSCSAILDFRLWRKRYRLVVKPSYCGASSQALIPLEGEEWLRGQDLRDGKLWRLPLVLWDILAYEFQIGRWGKPPYPENA
jgi:hypothetical protein